MAYLKKHGPTWWIAETDPITGKTRKVLKAFSDKRMSKLKLADWVRTRAAGEVVALDKYAEHRRRPLTDHLDDYCADLRAKGRAAGYVYNIDKRLRALLLATAWAKLADITADGFAAWRETVQDIGPVTKNQYLEALGGFCRWCVKRKRVATDATAGADKVDESTDIRHDRRAFTEDEVHDLLQVATTEHAAVYRLVLATGLRRNEVRQLQWGDVRLDAVHPFLKLRAKATKSRRADTLPLRADLANELRDRLRAVGDAAGNSPVYPDVPTIRSHKAYLKAAGIAYADDRGRYADFHALRHTFGTNLAKAGVSVRESMELMRHTDMRLTTKVYTDPRAFNLSAAVETLPSTSGPDFQRAKATGSAGNGGSVFMGSAMGSAIARQGAQGGADWHNGPRESVGRFDQNGTVLPRENHPAAQRGTDRRSTTEGPSKAGELGFEPRQADSETAVLPLHHSPSCEVPGGFWSRTGDRRVG